MALNLQIAVGIAEMFAGLFGQPPPPPPKPETTSVLDITTRRTEAEVLKLVRTFQGVLNGT